MDPINPKNPHLVKFYELSGSQSLCFLCVPELPSSKLSWIFREVDGIVHPPLADNVPRETHGFSTVSLNYHHVSILNG